MVTASLLFAERPHTGDAIFRVKSKRIVAHRNVLAAYSPKYKAQFYGPHPDVGEIHVVDIAPDAFEEFIKFFYGETVNFTTTNVEGILNQAKQCLITILVYECELFLMRKLTNENLIWNYRLSLLYDLEKLQEVCEQKIRLNVPKLFATNDFLQCEEHVLVHILCIDELIDCKEADIFEGCISWAQASCRRKKINDKSMKNLRAQLNSAIQYICFGSFNIFKFVELNEKYNGFFTPDEYIELTKIIGDLKNFRSKKFNQKIRKHSAVATQSSFNDSGTSSGSSAEGSQAKRSRIK